MRSAVLYSRHINSPSPVTSPPPREHPKNQKKSSPRCPNNTSSPQSNPPTSLLTSSHPHLLPFFPPATVLTPLLPPPTARPRYSPPSPFSAPQAAQSISILTVAQISPPAHARCTRAADGQKAAKTVLVWPQGWVWA